MSLITTPGSALANSYADLEYAEVYFDATGRISQWAAVGNEGAQEGLMLRAVLILDDLPLMGSRATVEQALEFPRIGRYVPQAGVSAGGLVSGSWTDRRGRVWASDAIADPIKQAQCEIALATSGDDARNAGRYKRRVVKTAGVELELREQGGLQGLSPAALLLLKPFLISAGGSGRSMRM